MSIGKKIQAVRKVKYLSQLELAEQLNTSQTVVSKYENDIIVPSAIVLKNIAKILKTSTDYLLGIEDLSINDSSLLKRFKEIDKLSQQDKTTVIHFIDVYLKDLQQRKKTNDTKK